MLIRLRFYIIIYILILVKIIIIDDLINEMLLSYLSVPFFKLCFYKKTVPSWVYIDDCAELETDKFAE